MRAACGLHAGCMRSACGLHVGIACALHTHCMHCMSMSMSHVHCMSMSTACILHAHCMSIPYPLHTHCARTAHALQVAGFLQHCMGLDPAPRAAFARREHERAEAPSLHKGGRQKSPQPPQKSRPGVVYRMGPLRVRRAPASAGEGMAEVGPCSLLHALSPCSLAGQHRCWAGRGRKMLVACGVSGRFQRFPPQAQRGGGRRRVSPRHAPARSRPRRPPRHQRARLRRLDGNPNSTRTRTRTRTPAPALTLTRPFTWPVAAATWRRLPCSSAAVHGQNAPARSRAAPAPFSHSSLKPTACSGRASLGPRGGLLRTGL